MQHIFLFCNDGYGKPFQAEFMRLASCNKMFYWHLVKSMPRPQGIRAKIHSFTLDRARNFLEKIYFSIHGITIHHTYSVNERAFEAKISNGSLGFVAGFNQIFRSATIIRFQYLLNFHPSILPYYRGAIPSYWAIKNREAFSGFTVHQITEKIDAGPIVYQEITAINSQISEHQLDRKIAESGCHFMRECVENYQAHRPFDPKFVESPYMIKAGYLPSKRE